MKITALLFLLAGLALAAGESSFHQSAFDDGPNRQDGWQFWSQRPATAPRAFVSSAFSLGAPGSLAISGHGNPGAYGGWVREVEGIVPGRWYRLTASYRSQGVAAPNWQVVARIDWRQQSGKREDHPEYAAFGSRQGDWTRLVTTVQAPANSSKAILQLLLANAPDGTVWWDDISFSEVEAPAPQPVKVASINLRPRNTGAKEASLAAFAATVRNKVPSGTDIILLPEGVTVVGTGQPYLDVAAPVPGADTAFLGQLAREKKAWLVAGVYERDGDLVYNTAVLLDRQGNLAGKYRKVYLPREEVEGGLTPGDAFPVFETDFGRVGMMICYDVFFPDPARALAVQGADIILMPIWGGPERLALARALENRVFLVASGYDHPTYVMDPDGERLASAPEQGSVAVSTIDLSKRYREQWLGEMRTRRIREIRADIPLPEPGLLSVSESSPK